MGVLKRKKASEDRLHEREEQEMKRKTEKSKLFTSQKSTSEHLQSSRSDEGDSDILETDSISGLMNDTNSDDNDWKRCSSEENRNVTAIPTIALEADRFSVSNRAAAAISTATLVDYGIISSFDNTLVIDHHKVWRARQKLRRDLKKAAIVNDENITELFFDGRKDIQW